jgi:hypothetical protein
VISIDATIAKKISAEVSKPTHHIDCEWELSHQYSSWIRLVQVTAYVHRFIENSKGKKNSQSGKELPIDVYANLILIPTRSESSLLKKKELPKRMECVNQ